MLADDDPDVRAALADLVSTDPAFELVAQAADAEEAVEIGHRLQPDIVVVDVQMPRGTGLRVVRELSVLCPATRLLALSGFADRKYVIQMLDAGAVGYMVKSPDLDLLGALRAVGRGERVLSHEATGPVLEKLSQHRFGAPRLGAARIAETLGSRSFAVAFQPIFDLASSAIVGVEALARLSPDSAFSPDVWFSEAWDVGLGPDLELAVVEEALARSRQRPPGTFLAVNVSPELAVDQRFAALVTGPLQTPDLVIELTEHYAVADYERLNDRLDRLRSCGVRVAVDDVGAGFASFRHVLTLHPDIIKLDVSLTAEIDVDSSRRALAAGLVAVGRELGATVIAEGIETADQLDCLVALGVEQGQGFYLARPSPFAEAVAARRAPV
jgi:EAL domain-containing protein (putative c-di-GMP-specific phosphodiesterase class I)/ActR/RegA family two-component response regulator